MCIPLSFRCCTTHWMPAITCETSVAPKASATLTLTMRASGAIPRNWSGPAVVTDVTLSSLPAIRLAMNVPWPFVSR